MEIHYRHFQYLSFLIQFLQSNVLESNNVFFKGHVNSINNKSIPLEASYSPDSQFVFSGSTDGKVHVWSTESGAKVFCFIGYFIFPIEFQLLITG